MPMRFFPDVLTHVNQNSSNAYSKFPTLAMMGCKCFGLFCSTFCRQTQLIETKFACAMPRFAMYTFDRNLNAYVLQNVEVNMLIDLYSISMKVKGASF